MRVAFFVTVFPCISQTFILEQVFGLLEGGCHVDVFLRWQESAAIPRHGRLDPATMARLAHPIGLDGHYARRLADAWSILTTAERGAPENTRRMLRALNPWRYGLRAASLELLFTGQAFLRQPAYDLLHAHFGPNGITAAMLRDLCQVRAPLVTTFYGYDLSAQLHRRQKRGFQYLFGRGDHFIALSQDMRQSLGVLGCPPEKIAVHPLGVDPRAFCPEHTNCPSGPIRVLSIGRLVPKKGLACAIQAISNLIALGHAIDYTIIGDGVLRGELEALACTRQVAAHVHFAGWKNRDEVLSALRQANLFLAPSQTAGDGDQEGLPVAIIEAMACCLPVVSTRHSGIGELITDGIHGYLTEPGDVPALTRVLLALCTRPDTWEALGQAARRKVLDHYDLSVLNSRQIQSYQEWIAAYPG